MSQDTYRNIKPPHDIDVQDPIYNLLLGRLESIFVQCLADCAGSECFDIMFVIDGTGQENVEDDIKQSLLFMTNVTNMFTIGSSKTLFGLYIIGEAIGERMVIALPFINTIATLRERLGQIT